MILIGAHSEEVAVRKSDPGVTFVERDVNSGGATAIKDSAGFDYT